MTEVTPYYITGDWRHLVEDGMVDHDPLPDKVLPTGHVQFEPISPRVAVAGTPATAYTLGPDKALIADGVLTDMQGREGIWLTGQIGGTTVRWRATVHLEFRDQKIAYPTVDFDLTEDVRLTGLIQQTGPHTPFVIDPRIEDLAGRLADVDQVVGQAEQIVSDAAQSVVDAKEHADRAEGLAVAQDEHVAGVLEDPTSQTHAAFKAVGNATYGDQTRSLVPSATIVAPELVPAPTAIPVDKFDGYVWGYSNTSHVYRSVDGITWTQHCDTPGGGQLSRLIPTTDGEVVLATFTGVYKSLGWSSTDASGVTWSQKVTANGQATINRFCFDGNGQKFIVTNYGPGAGQAWIDSRYAWISVDAGETWTLAYDTEAQTPNVGTDSHVHGVCYDPWDDIFIVSEGHNTGYGMYVSTDNGATWNLWDGWKMPMQPSPTCVVATNDGIVCTSDSEDAGMWGIVREGPLSTRRLRRTWRWSGSGRAGVIGFGQHAFRDPETGVVYCAFQSTTADESPIICAATAETASFLVGWDQSVLATVVGDSWRGVVVHDGQLIAGGNFGGQSGNYGIIARLPRPGSPTVTDEGNIRGGFARSNSSMAVGTNATVPGIDYQAVAVGGRSVARSLSVAVGERAEITEGSNRGTAVGNSAKSATSAVAVGDAANAANFATSIGSNATATGARTIAFGSGSTASGRDSTALGHGAQATAVEATAVGRNSQATHTNSVAHGYGTATSAFAQHAFGARHFAHGAVSADPAIPPAGELYTWWTLNADGVTWELWSRVPGTGAKKLLLSTAP